MRQELTLLRTEVSNVIQRVNADFSTLGVSLGKQTAAQKTLLRQEQLKLRGDYEEVQRCTKTALIELDATSRKISDDTL